MSDANPTKANKSKKKNKKTPPVITSTLPAATAEDNLSETQDNEELPVTEIVPNSPLVLNNSDGASGANPSNDVANVIAPPAKIPDEDMLNNVRGVLEQICLNSKKFRPAKSSEEALQKPYKFWSTQPVPKMDEDIVGNEAIEPDKPIDEIRAEPYTLPEGFKWELLDLDEPLQLRELYTLLTENYVEDDDAMFRFDYQECFLYWALKPPGWRLDWHLGVRVVKSGRLVAFISAIPGTLNVYQSIRRMVEINFLCVHKKLRAKRLAPVLIREITRRVNRVGIFQAVYTAGVVLPKPVSSCRYWHRSLNPKKLIEVRFSHLARNMTMKRTMQLYQLPEQTKTPGFRMLQSNDSAECCKMLNNYLLKYSLSPQFTLDEFKHWFSNKTDIINCFVVEDPDSGKITGMVSFYTLASTVMHHQFHKRVNAAYLFYLVSTVTPLEQLMNDALISAKALNFDVFNALDLMENKEFLKNLKFGKGDGNLQYYLYNWRCPQMKPEETGLILL